MQRMVLIVAGMTLLARLSLPALAAQGEVDYEARGLFQVYCYLDEPEHLASQQHGGVQLAAFQDEESELPLPPVTVTPVPENEPDYVPRNYYPPGAGWDFSEYSVPWNSGAIYSDTQRVGPYNQPVWTTQRPFANSRVYVLPPGQMQVEQWVRPTFRRHGDKAKYRFLEEYAIGLPGRFQLDIYERWNIEPDDNNNEKANHEGVQVELRWALANWGVIPLNPTLYIEWVERGGAQDKPDLWEAKLLLADELLPNLFYASNLIIEQEIAGERTTELAWSHALGSTIIERKLMGGIEMNWSGETVQGGRNDAEYSFTIGPSLQYRPTNRTFLDVVGLFGTTPDSPECQMYIVFGYQFGARSGPSFAPASTIAN